MLYRVYCICLAFTLVAYTLYSLWGVSSKPRPPTVLCHSCPSNKTRVRVKSVLLWCFVLKLMCIVRYILLLCLWYWGCLSDICCTQNWRAEALDRILQKKWNIMCTHSWYLPITPKHEIVSTLPAVTTHGYKYS